MKINELIKAVTKDYMPIKKKMIYQNLIEQNMQKDRNHGEPDMQYCVAKM